MGYDLQSSTIQECRKRVNYALDVGTFTLGGYGLAKGAAVFGMKSLPAVVRWNKGMLSQCSKRWALADGYLGSNSSVMYKTAVEVPRKIETSISFNSICKPSSGAENVNASVALSTKLRQLENMQQSAAKIRILPDGRVRYYKAERIACNPGPTRSSAYVTEYNPNTGKVRGWNVCYDQYGNINRVHPKNLNGQSLVSPHYPLIGMEIIK